MAVGKVATLLCLCLAAWTVNASLDFPTEVPYPRSDYDKAHVLTAPTAVVDGNTVDLRYEIVLRSGERADPSDPFGFGVAIDVNGQPVYQVTEEFGLPDIVEGEDGQPVGNFYISSSQDFTSLLTVGEKLFSVVHFEDRPGGMYVVELSQDEVCRLQAENLRPVNWTAWGGLWTPCAGSVTPWNSHLGSEEYEPNARALEEATVIDDVSSDIISFMRYFGYYPNDTTVEDVKANFKPYKYGYPTEVTVMEDGSYEAVKHYAMGRFSIELPYVMSDNRTVYITDDGTNVGFWQFRAETPGDMNCGELFGARFTQLTDNRAGGNFTIEWISLGSACQEDIAPAVENTLFTDLFDVGEAGENSTCSGDFNPIHTSWGFECLKVKAGMEQLASRLESRRYGAILGVTTEWNKWEGITFSPYHGDNGRLYTAMSTLEGSTEDLAYRGEAGTIEYDYSGSNRVRLPYLACGCVYALDVDADYQAYNMYPLVCGNTETGTDENNDCDVNGIANPDNVAMLTGHNALLIGEDSGEHENNLVWVYDFQTGRLVRVQTAPSEAENTGTYWHPNVNGCAYIFSIIQHPGDELTGTASYFGYMSLPASEWDMQVGATTANQFSLDVASGDPDDYSTVESSSTRRL